VQQRKQFVSSSASFWTLGTGLYPACMTRWNSTLPLSSEHVRALHQEQSFRGIGGELLKLTRETP